MRRRPHILFAWELGSNFGHVAKIAPIVRAIGDRAEITFAARDAGMVHRFAPDLTARIVDAPHAPTNRRPGPAAVNFSDNLRHVGFDTPEGLRRLLARWVDLLTAARPDILVAQAAPSALLAARALPIRTVVYGGGFDLPPLSAPMPPFLHWASPAADLQQREARVLDTTNAALQHLGLPPLERLADFLDADMRLLATVPELDHYGPRARWEREAPDYLGHVYAADTGAELAWRTGAAHRIIAYLRPDNRAGQTMVAALARASGDADIVLSAPCLDQRIAGALARSRVRWVDGPIRLDRLLPDASLGISHGSSGTTAAFFFAGVPQIGLPNHTEQVMQIRAAAEAGTAIALMGEATIEDYRSIIARALSSRRFRKTTRSASRRYAGQSANEIYRTLADKVLSLS